MERAKDRARDDRSAEIDAQKRVAHFACVVADTVTASGIIATELVVSVIAPTNERIVVTKSANLLV
jgi:hypothetical protein